MSGNLSPWSYISSISFLTDAITLLFQEQDLIFFLLIGFFRFYLTLDFTILHFLRIVRRVTKSPYLGQILRILTMIRYIQSSMERLIFDFVYLLLLIWVEVESPIAWYEWRKDDDRFQGHENSDTRDNENFLKYVMHTYGSIAHVHTERERRRKSPRSNLKGTGRGKI